MKYTMIEASFAKRTEQQIAAKVKSSDPSVPKFEGILDFSKLSEPEVLDWARRGVTIAIQSRLDSGALDLKENFWYEVPKPADRARLSPEDKLRRLIAEFLKIEIEEVTDEQIKQVSAKLLAE